jgi:uncharacterized phage protein (TIGR01671 family)
MMREIKFRGIRVDNGEWAYGYYWQRADGKHYIHSIDRSVDYEDIQVIPETVGQSTGLKDKTGKEIFEGDIVAYTIFEKRGHGDDVTLEYEDRKEEVCWNEKGGYWGAPIIELAFQQRYDDELKVIGNIHEHPSLIQGKEKA